MILLVVVGMATVIGVIIIAVIETRRADTSEPTTPQQPSEKPADRKKS
jgi:heme/copper-type cytochrome/quinol oxidase subunit 2